ncbi:membrane protein [Actinorhabdospora filicis]|uniref:Membrane protein n=1 Tax=Actinorhabdospora filicis TaxID=1785913 RepID=A0A9W6WB42_9ACTN|nr:DUF881 domain-containing protein [Actinorhabdospora filicis]GLZ79206.1 membrane protein [Actinorhabdospora filicis]
MDAETEDDGERETVTGGNEAPEADASSRNDESEAGENDLTVTAPNRRKRRVSLTIGVLVALLGFAAVVQVRNHGEDPELSGARQEDLVRILADLDARQARLADEIADLENSKRQLTSGAEGGAAALAEAKGLADELGILAGTLGAKGPGLILEFRSGAKPIRAATILDAVEELRGAGMEAAQIDGENGASVRIVASTFFLDGQNGLIVDDATLTGVYRITVIGDPATMDTALRIPGGVVDNVGKDGGTVVVNEPGEVRVTTIVAPSEPKYAKPVD